MEGFFSQPRAGRPPRERIAGECARRGREAVVAGCVALLQGRSDSVDDELMLLLGGPGASRMLSGESRADTELWQRVWATRGLLWAWDESADPALSAALADDGWRVRELAVKVVRRHLLGDHLPEVARLVDDPVARVRAVAVSTLARLTAARA